MTADAARRHARWIAGLYVVTIVAGGWGESHVPDMLLIGNDVAGTAHRLAGSTGLFRASFAAYLLEAVCDITLNVLLFELLRPVSRQLAFLAVCFGLIATAIYAAGELVYFAAALPVVDTDVAFAMPPDVKATLTYLGLTIYGYVNGIFAVFYGIAATIRGCLMLRSGYLPRVLGILFIVGGAGFITKNALVVATPHYDVPYVILPLLLAMTSWVLWALIRGVDSARWEAMQVSRRWPDDLTPRFTRL